MNAPTLPRRTLLKSGALAAAGGLLASSSALAAGRPRIDGMSGDEHIVMIIRHGEKQHGHAAPYGVTAAGIKDKESLTTTGWARAGGLVNLFAPAEGVPARPGIPRPADLYASNLHGPAGGSRREQETVSLVAEQLKLKIDLRFGVGDEKALAAALDRAGSPVLVCWEHHHIPALARALGTTAPVPSKWPGDRFDVIWQLSRPSTGGPYSLEQIPELVLPGDSPRPIS